MGLYSGFSSVFLYLPHENMVATRRVLGTVYRPPGTLQKDVIVVKSHGGRGSGGGLSVDECLRGVQVGVCSFRLCFLHCAE